MYVPSFSLGPARIIKIKTTITEPQSQMHATVLLLLCCPVHKQNKICIGRKKKATLKKNKDEPYDGFLKIYFGKNSIISFSGVPGIKIEL